MRHDHYFDDAYVTVSGSHDHPQLEIRIRHVVDFPDSNAPLAAFDAITRHLARNLRELERDVVDQMPPRHARAVVAALERKQLLIQIVLGPTTNVTDEVLEQVRSRVERVVGADVLEQPVERIRPMFWEARAAR
jgi:hypothetical protein